jgi:[ribosomal protein S5]-alanine N-acetyltransferase
MIENIPIEQRCKFEIDRLLIQSWKYQIAIPLKKSDFAKKVINILTPKVTKNLPDGWNNINSIASATDWIKNRAEESSFLTVQFGSTKEIVGFVFLNESVASDNFIDLRLGFLLSEVVWGKGVGSELISGLVRWCANEEDIRSISGGVEIDNIGSINVLEKNGFIISNSDNQKQDMVFLKRKFTIKKL